MSQLQVKLFFQAGFLRQQIVQGLIPQLQLLEAHFHPVRGFPLRFPATAWRGTDVELFQPGCQRMLAARTGEAIGQQRKEALREGLTVAERGAARIQHPVQRQLRQEVADHQQGSPSGSLGCGDVLATNPARGGGIGLQEAHQGVEMRSQEVLAPEVNDNALLDLRALAIGFNQPQILVVAAWRLDGADEQIAPPKTLRISRGQPISQGENSLSTKMLALHILNPADPDDFYSTT